MRKKYKQRTFSGQIRLYYLILFLVIFALCGILYAFTAYRTLSESEDNTLQYSLQMVENNMQSLIQSVNDSSKIVAFHDMVQRLLKKGTTLTYEEQMELQDTVIQISSCSDGISSIYLFDEGGEAYLAGNIFEIRSWLEDDSGYEAAIKDQEVENFNYVIFTYEMVSAPGQKIISFIRPVRNLDTLEDMGILAVNVPYTRLEETFSTITGQNGMEVAVLDRGGEVLAASEGGEWLADAALDPEEGVYKTAEQNGEKYKVGVIGEDQGAWKIVGAIPKSESVSAMRQYTLLNVLIVGFGMVMCTVGASFQTTRIIRPIQNILNSMNKIREGKLERIKVIETNEEIDHLQQHYNQMLDETEKLMTQKVEEQRMRRKYELSLLQAQIKPHFLYNTFDSVCALAMMGRTDDVYTMMQALGQYYRNSLHKGQEIITVKEELNIVENYLIIQSFRYDDVFEVVYDIDEAVKTYRMIKLILQPLVENAIYHGFREHELQGTITIRAKDDGDYVKLQVEDDGIGMDQEKLDAVMNRTEDNQGKRFGLFGTIQRIHLYYQEEKKKLVEIRSEKGKAEFCGTGSADRNIS